MKRLIYITTTLCLFLATSCSDSRLAEMQVDPKNPTTVPGETLFSQAERTLWDQMVNTSVNLNIFRLLSQQWTQTTYIDESTYNITTRTIPDNHWGILYRNVLQNFNQAATVLKAQPTSSATEEAARKNQLAVIEILTVYTYQVLVDTFGNIPYSEALNYEKPNPKYDDAPTIYADLLKRLDAAIASLNTSAGSFGTADLVYGGDVSKWAKFANSLKVKLGITLADVDSATAKTIIEAAASKVFTSNADNAALVYQSITPNTNPIWLDIVQSGRKDYVATKTIVDLMNTLADPRRSAYFTPLNGAYVGGVVGGGGNTYNNSSQVSSKITDPTLPGVLLSYDEVQFYLAEAAARGFSVGGTAESYYNKGVTASITYWGGSAADAAAYLATPAVAYATATGDYKQKIGTQAWLALYNRGFEAWTEWRRLDYPKLTPPPGQTAGDIPVRYTYPVNEQTLNSASYTAASAAIGSDKKTTKLFWDKF